MYRIEPIVESFKTLVGWNEEGESLSENLTQSDSGLYFQEAHPMLTLRSLKNVMPESWVNRYMPYENGGEYAKNDIVSQGCKAFISLKNNNTDPLSDTSSWANYDSLNDYLNDLEERGIKKVVTRFVEDKVIGMETKNIIDRRCLFDGTGRLNARIENSGKIVGFEITPLRTMGVTMKIEKVGLQFVGNSGTIKLYLFHSSKVEPVWTKNVTYNLGGSFLWVDVNEFLPYLTDSTNAGGSWYLCYYQPNLPAYLEAINFGRDWSREPCGTCNKGDLILYRQMMKWVDVSPFYVAMPSWDEQLWDIANNMYSNTLNYGLNIMFSIGCDITDTLIASRMDFANAVKLSVASEALRTIAFNPEVSVARTQYNADRDNILYETDGNGHGIKGLKGELDKAMKALAFDTKGMDGVCLKCKSSGLKYGMI